MQRRRTILETVQPAQIEFKQIARKWRSDASTIMLGWVWAGYDLLVAEILSKVDWNMAKDDLEREITELLVRRIRRCMAPITFCDIQHEPKERETRKPAPAQPPEYDLAFVLYANERTMWPMEAKILKTDQQVSAYVEDVKNEFLTCRYAPFSDEGAMLGYMLSGHPDRAFLKISQALSVKLTGHRDFPDRDHRVSSHLRKAPKNKPYPTIFCIHHLMMPLK
jgi:hypothetical protein